MLTIDASWDDAPRPARRRAEDAAFRSYAKGGDARTRDELIRSHLPLADSIARRFDRGGRASLDDLKQVAAIGMIKAVDRFDPSRGIAFSSYAVPTIQGELRRYLRDFTWSVRPPRELLERAVRLSREREMMTNELGRSPTAAELAGRMGCTVEDVIDGMQAAQARGADSLDSPDGGRGDDDAATIGERIPVAEDGYAAAETSTTVASWMAELSERERRALQLRFRDDLTQAEIGQRLGCSQMHVSRILRTALARLEEVAHAEAAADARAARR